MISQFRLLYLENRTDTLEALDSMPQLKHVHNLKAKILFSIIVVSCDLVDFDRPADSANVYLPPKCVHIETNLSPCLKIENKYFDLKKI